jgi:hypothetical protein
MKNSVLNQLFEEDNAWTTETLNRIIKMSALVGK